MTTSDPTLTTSSYAPAQQLSDTTRGLCSGAYVDVTYANEVIAEIVESERKAVPPSFGFDLDPVVRHCLRARRLLIIRYAMATGVLLLSFCLTGWLPVFWLTLCMLIEVVRGGPRARVRALGVGVSTIAVLGFIAVAALVTTVLVLARLSPDWLDEHLASLAARAHGSSLADALGTGLLGVAGVTALLPTVAMVVLLFASRWHAYGILFGELAPGADATAPPTRSVRVERRLATVARMQRGNIAVHDVNPFAGAGILKRGWSFVVTLRPSGAAENGNRVAIDPHELNKRVNDAVLAMRDTKLSGGERIPNLYTVAYVAADGYRRHDDPLIDQETHTPFTTASPETITAIESCPQGGLRHYLRVVIPANGKEIRTADDRPVLGAQDSGISVTAFVHLAVEGGLLYTEFAAHVLPPLRPDFRIADTLRADRVPARAWRDTLREYVRDNLYAPWWLVRNGWDALRLTARMSRSTSEAEQLRFYDYGARFSVRDRAGRETTKFMQKLDGAKYIKLVDKTVTEAVLGFLRDNGVDTSEFENQVVNNTYGDLTFHGGVQNFGGTNTVRQKTTVTTSTNGASA
ncbi:DUF389 domain-containing protein [Actinoplanes sp. KI2]|uniref:DUF389 domain-containing protein n=1 Tax=Actinoplanes sp. KI2 TaxID=2983315 RepID=UPI0021D5B5D5|nr:DUF389 domain-containing protein [Actinoplanes sp. KI2]MCU7725457.1 DUF389 domain-containing protein [Actinoplanes sp. KI2]